MKKYLVIGDPIDHSLSPLLHNFWIRKHGIDAIYEKKLLKQKVKKMIRLCQNVTNKLKMDNGHQEYLKN